MKFRLFFFLALVLAMALPGCSKKNLELKSAELLPQPKALDPQLGLTDSNGNKATLAGAKGNWVLIFFGYTHCADFCPLELQQLAKMQKMFEENHAREKPAVVFISVDPERDNNMVLKYATAFDASILGVTGHSDELAAFASAFDATYNRVATIQGKEVVVVAGADMPKNAGKDYMVNHSSRIYIINPQLQYVGSFPTPHQAELMYHDMEQLMEAAR